MVRIRTLVTVAACLALTGCSTPPNGSLSPSGAADPLAVPAGTPSLSKICDATAVDGMLVNLVGEQAFSEPVAEEKEIKLFGTGKETSCRVGWPEGFGFAALTNFVSDADAKAAHDANAGAIASIGKIATKFKGVASGAELASAMKLDKKHYAKEGKEELLIHCVGVHGTLGVTVGFRRVSPAMQPKEQEEVSTALCIKADELIAGIQGGLNGSTEPGAIAVPSDPPSSPEAPDERSVGLWAGQVEGDSSSYDILVDIKKGDSGFEATVNYPQLKCTGAWKEESVDTEALYFRERISGQCVNNLQVKLTKSNEQVLHAEFMDTTVQADMTRIGD